VSLDDANRNFNKIKNAAGLFHVSSKRNLYGDKRLADQVEVLGWVGVSQSRTGFAVGYPPLRPR
jgi:hypothetical protein